MIRATALVAAFALAVAGCAPPGPEDAARRLFDLAAQREEPDAERLAALFAIDGSPAVRAALLDAIDAVEPLQRSRVDGVTSFPGERRVIVDISGDLPGGGLARYSVECRRDDAGAWRVAWFQGPGVAWPPPRGSTGEGLSSSPPPAAPPPSLADDSG